MNKNSGPWWKTPWSYKESFAVVGGLIASGIMLQLSIGNFDYEIIRYPVNIYLLILTLIAVAVLTLRHKSHLFQWLAGVPLSVANISGLLLYSIIMGLTMQAPANADGQSALGFDAVTRSWPFVIVFYFTLLNLSCVTSRRLLNFHWRDYAFYLNHLGLLVLLYAGGFGAADLRRYVMHVEEGATEWRVYNEKDDVLELPLAIKLNDFYMEEYIPKLAIIDRRTGDAIPNGNPQMWQIDTTRTTANIAGWNIQLEKYIPEAVRKSDSTYQQIPMPGSCPAALVKVENSATGFNQSGWICCGNFAQLYMTMQLNDTLSLVMTRPEPKLFRSDIEVYTPDEKTYQAQLEVNKPLRVGHWMIYQYSYDADAGKASAYSSFELVYDPWMTWVYVGIFMFLAGSIFLLWEGNKKARRKNA